MNKNISILVLDNYDSFTYNLVHIIKALGYTNLEVHRNDKITLDEIQRFDKILLSPGPGIPSEAGILQDVIRTYAGKKSIFGVCLGHQAIGEVFGGTLTNLEKVYHGIASKTQILNKGVLFEGLPEEITTGRYHSWVVDTKNFPDVLEITATDEQGKIMALKHKTLDLVGVQFHPESILTEFGKKMVQNWLEA
ncbi:anthranilate synthase component II [Cytophaga hutchinsonii]|jgi:anthranilate synthase component 2|uniref:Anthranilate synthase, component II n=1 Tax=Cytophaga hutchinsonii (strain ATCC 33406 / DSM 1761 / CIP 103989 / NBRC 15051 / NCIMB 9469 / D465) TaxID=269798 RepID=A0A6N4SVJ3_CYTH3|nr:aminodeoxychorismate/anthranilate synthase component II [Cytophaga hutchinsonii]ABG60530.1 anthranilate synthase, component II [Cytophaga hutchinsonii ATCC 33406]SFX90661.1 anthranilate synthase, component II [Cytophaga hutchinsonii ATCC 33406]